MILHYDIAVQGIAAVDQAFAHIEGRISRLNRAAAANPVNGGRSSELSDVMTATGWGAGGKAAERAEAAKTRAAEKEEKQRTKAAEKEAIRQERAREKAAQADIKNTQRAAKEAEKAEQRKTEAANKEAAKRERIAEREAAAQMRLAAQREKAEKRKEEARKREEERETARKNKEAVRDAKRETNRRYDRLAGIAGNTWGTVSGLGVMALGAAGLGAGALFATAVHAQIGTIANASKLANQFSENGASIESIRQTKSDLMREAGQVRGFSPDEVLEGISRYHEKTGEAQSARNMVPRLAALSLATGSKLEDVAEFGSTIHNVLKTKGINGKEAEDMTYQLVNNAAAVAKEKSIELRDFARVGGSVIAQAPLLTGNVAANARMAMGITQMAVAGGATSAEEAATSFQNMVGDMVKHQKTLKKMGIKDSIKDGRLDLSGTLGQVLEKTNGDIDKAMKVFNIRGLRAFGGLGVMYKTAEDQQKGSGKAAVMNELSRLANANLSEETIKSGVASRMEDPDMQWKEAQKALNRAIGQELVPVITRMIPSIAELAPAFGRLAQALAGSLDFLAKNPFSGIGIIVTAALVKEIASAALGTAVKAAFMDALAVAPRLAAAPTAAAVATNAATAVPAAAAAAPGAGMLAGAGLAGTTLAASGILFAIAATYGMANTTQKAIEDAKWKEGAEPGSRALMRKALAGEGSAQEKLDAIDTAERTTAEARAARLEANRKSNQMLTMGAGMGRTGMQVGGNSWAPETESATELETIQRERETYEKLREAVIIQSVQRNGGAGAEFMTDTGANPLGIGRVGAAGWHGGTNTVGASDAAPKEEAKPKEDVASSILRAAEAQLQAAAKTESSAEKLNEAANSLARNGANYQGSI